MARGDTKSKEEIAAATTRAIAAAEFAKEAAGLPPSFREPVGGFKPDLLFVRRKALESLRSRALGNSDE